MRCSLASAPRSVDDAALTTALAACLAFCGADCRIHTLFVVCVLQFAPAFEVVGLDFLVDLAGTNEDELADLEAR